MNRVDIAIIGTGPAGISAAITGKIRNKSILLIGSRDLSINVQKAHVINNYTGLPRVTGEELKNALSAHLKEMDIDILEKKVNCVYAMGDYFSIEASNESYEATTVIIATGVNFGKPLEGEEEYLGRGVSYCATCDGMFYAGKNTALIGYTKEAEKDAEFLSEIAKEVYYFPMYKEEVNISDKIKVIDEKPVRIDGKMKAECLVTNDGSYNADGIFIIRNAISPAHLVPSLKMNGNHIEVNLNMETNIPGCYACGDIAGKPYQYIKAAGQGNVAALSAVAYIDSK